MPHPFSRLGVAVAALFVVSGCFVFDESLYMNVGPRIEGEPAEVCGAEAPLLVFPEGAQAFEFDIVTSGRTNNTSNVSRCTGRVQGGPDVFLSLDARESEHWHFHVDVDPFEGSESANPAIYVLRDCDERACSEGDGLDLCSAGADEHFTFVPDADDRYVVALDSASDTGFQGRLLVFRTICGDGQRDHSENCDDGNTDDGDGCDSQCRSELSGSNPAEIEVNDDPYGANHLVLEPGTPMNVRGSVDSVCESDTFAIVVPEGGSIVATLQGEGGAACGADLDGISLDLLELATSGPSVRVSGSVPAGEVCPAIAADATLARALAAGTYYLRVTHLPDRVIDSIPYTLSVTLESP